MKSSIIRIEKRYSQSHIKRTPKTESQKLPSRVNNVFNYN